LASNTRSLDMSDLQDVIEQLEAFQEQNSCYITLKLRTARRGETGNLWVEGRAFDRKNEPGGRKLLGYASVNSSQERFRSLAGLFTFLLYQLDFQIASYEWEGKAGGETAPAAPGE
jgi:hypothetical protein